jgi:hypothetical protein
MGLVYYLEFTAILHPLRSRLHDSDRREAFGLKVSKRIGKFLMGGLGYDLIAVTIPPLHLQEPLYIDNPTSVKGIKRK